MNETKILELIKDLNETIEKHRQAFTEHNKISDELLGRQAKSLKFLSLELGVDADIQKIMNGEWGI